MQLQSAGIVLLMLAGIILRKKRRTHIQIMSLAMIWDVLLILQIELSRSAVAKASKVVTNPMMLNIHVFIALTTVLLYVFMVYTGRGILSGQEGIRFKHKILGYTTFFLRILTFVTSFWAVASKDQI